MLPHAETTTPAANHSDRLLDRAFAILRRGSMRPNMSKERTIECLEFTIDKCRQIIRDLRSDEAGQKRFASKAEPFAPTSSPHKPTIKTPTPEQRAAATKVATEVGSYFHKMPDGRLTCLVHLRELHHYRKIGSESARLSGMLLEAHKHEDQNLRVRDVETEASLAKLIKRAEQEALRA